MKKLIPFVLSLIVATNFYSQSQYCTSGGPANTTDSNVESVDLTGSNSTSIAFTGCPGVAGVVDNTSLSVDLIGDSTYNIDVVFGSCGGYYNSVGEVWIDWSGNQAFDQSESIGIYSPQTPTGNDTTSFTFTVPPFALNGQTRIRVMQYEDWNSSGVNNPLDPCASYAWGSVTDFTANISGAFTPTCPKPTNLTASNITSNSADLSWTAGGTETSWNIEYSFAGFTQGTGNLSTISVINPTITGLNSSSNYQYYVQAICGTNDISVWSGPYTFTTLYACPSNAVCATYNSGDIPSDFDFDSNGENSSCPGELEVIIPTGYVVDSIRTFFDMTALSSGFAWMSEQRHNLKLSNSTTGSGPTIAGQNGNIDGTESYDYTVDYMFGYNLADTVNIELHAGRTYGGLACGTAHNYVDSASWTVVAYYGTLQSCVRPLSNFFSLSNISATNGDLSWLTAGNESLWEVQWGPSGFPLGNGFIDTTSSNQNFSMTNLSPSTSHDVYVRAICGVGDTSLWSRVVTFTTPCFALTPPQIEDFSTGVLPTICWTQAGDGTPSTGPTQFGTSGWTTDGFQNVGNTGAARCNLFTTGDNEWLISPQYDFSTGGPYQIEFDFGIFPANGTSPGTLGSDDRVEVLISRDGGASWSGIRNFNNSYITALGGSHEIVALPNDSGTVQFAFWASEGSINDAVNVDVMLDNFEITNMPSCPQISTLLYNNVTDSSVDLSWFIVGSETSWNVQYGQPGFTIGTGSNVVTNNNSYTLSSLNSANTYDVYVQAICSTNDVSLWVGPINFTTLCGNAVPPSLEDFDSGFPLCWSQDQTDDFDWTLDASGTPSTPTGPSDDITGGGNYMYIETSAPRTTGDSALLFSENYDLSSLNSPEITFYSHMFGASVGELSVWITDTSGISNQVFIKNGDQGDQWNEEIVSLSSYSGIVQFTILGVVSDDGNGTSWWGDIAIDNFEVSEAPSCQKPVNFTLGTITSTTSSISWGIFNGVDSVFNVQYGTAGFTLGNGLSSTVSGDTNYTITGLNATSNYDVYIQTVCGSDSSIWIGPYSFSTLQNPGCIYTVNMIDSYGDGWNGATIDVSINGAFYTSLSNTSLALPNAVQTDSFFAYNGDNVSFSFSSGTYDNEITFEIIDPTFNSLTLGYIPAPAVDGVFLVDSSSTSICQAPSCLAPLNLSASNITVNSADLTWTVMGTETLWSIQYGLTGFVPGSGTIIAANNDTILLTGLSSSIIYDYYVKAICGPGDSSSWSGPFSFNTLIQEPLGISCSTGISSVVYSEDFENGQGSWTGIDNSTLFGWTFGTSPSFLTGPSAAHSGNNYLYFDATSPAGSQNTNESVVSPMIDLSSVTADAELSFWLHSYGSEIGRLKIGISNIPTGQFSNVFSYDGQIQTAETDSFVNVGIDLSNYIGQQIYLEFDYTFLGWQYGDVAIDLIEISSCVSCPAPTALSVSNLTVNSADLSWTAGNTETSWNIQYGTSGFIPGSGTTVGVTTNPYSLTGLSASTTYDYYVKAICAPGDSSSWAGPFTFATACGTVLAPYFNNFDSGFPICWSQDSTDAFDWTLDANGTASFPTGPSDDITGGGNYMYIETSAPRTTGDSALLVSTSIDISTLNSPELIFYSHMFGASIGELSVWITDTSSTATQVFVKNGDQGDQWNEEIVSLSNYSGVFQVTILAVVSDDGSGTSFWGDIAIDNFEVRETPSCQKPVNFGAYATSNSSAIATWLPASSNDSLWHVYLVPDTIQGSAIVPDSSHLIVSNNDTLSLAGLNPSSDYLIYVRTICSATDSSSLAGPVSFSTFSNCPIPGTLSLSNKTLNSAVISWLPNYINTSVNFEIEYGLTGFTPSNGVIDTTSFTNYTLTGLDTLTNYDFYVRSICDTNNILSGPFTFTTLEYCPNPDSLIISNITANSADFNWVAGLIENEWNVEYGPSGYPFGSGTLDTTYVTNYSITNIPTSGGGTSYDFYLRGQCSVDGSVWTGPFTFTTLPTCTSPDSLSVSNITASSVDLSWIAGSLAQSYNIEYGPVGFPTGFGFTNTSNTTSFNLSGLNASSSYEAYVQSNCGVGDSSIWIGPVSFTTGNSCPNPDSLSFSNIGITTADLSWIAGGTETEWNIEYGPAGFPQGSPNIPNVYTSVVTTNTYTITGLLDGFNYDFYVQASCGAGDSSDWIGPVSFTTIPFCQQPTSLSADSITSSSAKLSWIAGGTEIEWNIEYGVTGFPQGTGFGVVVPFINNYNLNGLSDATTYDYYVQAVCGVSDSSLFSGPYTFTTCKDADTTTVSSCVSYSWNGNVYNTSGTYAYSYLPILGCGDTVVDILNLTVGGNYSTMDTILTCDSYSWNGNNYTTSGTYTDSIQTTLGCDSIVTLILTINNSPIIQDNQTSCDSVYLWNGNLLNLTGSYLDTLQSINGCDSIVKLNLTLNYSPSSLTPLVICKGDSIKFGAMTYSLAGIYTDTLLSSIGCDSLAKLDLSVTEITVSIDTSQANVTANVSGGIGPYVYYWSNGDSSSTLFPDSVGLYQIFVVDANGCVSDTATYNATSVG
ncbi:fibronectin type III domain-containing protein, partial [Flavobacteriales bacterium]|nr:fibronectin type III domain-containing protein [Flavobacteriales bacterium]